MEAQTQNLAPCESMDLANWQQNWMNEHAWEEMEFDFELDLSFWSIIKDLFSFSKNK